MTARDGSGLTRREFLVTSGAVAVGVAGYTLAAGPVRADVISTPATGIEIAPATSPEAGVEITSARSGPAASV